MKNKSIWLLVAVLILADIQALGLAQPLAQYRVSFPRAFDHERSRTA